MADEALTTEYRGHSLVYFGGDEWGMRDVTGPGFFGTIDAVKKMIDQWEVDRQKASGITIWHLDHSDPKYWDKRCGVYFTPGSLEGRYSSRPHRLETRNGADPDSFYAVNLGDAAPDTPEVAAAIEVARTAYEEAVAAHKRFKEAKRAIPRLKPEDVASLPPRPGSS